MNAFTNVQCTPAECVQIKVSRPVILTEDSSVASVLPYERNDRYKDLIIEPIEKTDKYKYAPDENQT